MKHLSNRYAKVMEYKGMDICTLGVATPSDGDELGYRLMISCMTVWCLMVLGRLWRRLNL